jgi:hypothetical protein
MPGRCFASRVCASLVRAAGLPELVVEGAEAYVAQAVALGRDPARLAALRARLLAGRDTALLFDTPRCVGALEALFRRIWAEFQAGALPRPALDNLDLYLEIGAAMDHDAAEFSGLADYEARYREALATRDGFQAVPPDGRLWRRGLAA